MASPKTVIVVCSAVFIAATAWVALVQFLPNPDPVALLDGRFLPDSGDTELQKWAGQPDRSPLPQQRSLSFSAQIKDIGAEKKLVVEQDEQSELPDVAPGPLVTLEPGQAIETDSGTFRLLAFAVFDHTIKPPRFSYAMTARGEPIDNVALKKLGWGGGKSWSSTDSYLRGIAIFQKTRDIRPAHFRSLSSADITLAKSERAAVASGAEQIHTAEFHLPFDPASRVALALDLYSKPVTAGRIRLEEGAKLDCGDFGELHALSLQDWDFGNSVSRQNKNGHRTDIYSGKPGRMLAILRSPNGATIDRFVFKHLQTGKNFESRWLNSPLVGLVHRETAAEAEVSIYRSANRVIQKLPPLRYPKFTGAADPLDWEIPDSLKQTDNRAMDTVYCVTGLRLDLWSLRDWQHSETMRGYADCRTVRDMLRKIHDQAVAQNLLLVVNRAAGFITVKAPEPTWWERLRKFMGQFR